MLDNISNQKERVQGQNGRRLLLGKVVLLVSSDTAVLQNLVTQLAQKGADVALLCWQLPLETTRKIKESVQAAGRHLLVIELVKQKTSSGKQIIETITSELGHLDIFIDLSAQRSKPEESTHSNGHLARFGQPNWQLTQAILQEMSRS